MGLLKWINFAVKALANNNGELLFNIIINESGFCSIEDWVI